MKCDSQYEVLLNCINELECEKQTLYLLLGELIFKNQLLRDELSRLTTTSLKQPRR